jgi:hypothetical protein
VGDAGAVGERAAERTWYHVVEVEALAAQHRPSAQRAWLAIRGGEQALAQRLVRVVAALAHTP